MTAEIAILNKSAVALAADSKVTIAGVTGVKTFDTVNKLFTLSKVHPVGIMVFNAAEFMGYPWELIVKMYRAQKRARDELTIEKWGDDFLSYLLAFGEISEDDKRDNVFSILASWFDGFWRATDKRSSEENIQFASPEYVNILKDIIAERIGEAERKAEIFDAEWLAATLDQYSSDISDLIKLHFGGFKEDQALVEIVSSAVPKLLGRALSSPNCSGIVIAGFGRNEKFPTLVHYETDGYVGDRVKLHRERIKDIGRSGTTATIIPFAQKEMVQTFMGGIDPDFHNYFYDACLKGVLTNCLAVLDEYGKDDSKTDEVRAKIQKATNEAVNKMMMASADYQMKTYSDPVMDMVALLPKEELPHMAESLVALTSLKRHVSDDAETVGGPIDVALISKSDGFIWIKRKHYFKSELNPQFHANYMRGIDDSPTQRARGPAAPKRPAKGPVLGRGRIPRMGGDQSEDQSRGGEGG